MSDYRHTQRATLLLRVFGSFIIAAVIVACFTIKASPTAGMIAVIISVILAIAAYLFHSLRIEVSPTEIHLAFGPGLIKKRFPVSEITSARTVENWWYYGWGIRYTPHGWLFNVSGFDAVEIESESGRKYRIGTDEPEKLCAAISAAIGGGA